MEIPSAPKIYTGRYEDLRGVNFSQSSVEVDHKHSPDMLNMISDDGGNPRKRVGWRKEYRVKGEVLDLYFDDKVKYIAYWDALYNNGGYIVDASKDINGVSLAISSDKHCKMMAFNGSVYAFGIGEIRNVTGFFNNLPSATPDIYVPEVTISKNADGTGGTFLESVNLLTPKRKMSFYDEGKSTKFMLYPKSEISEILDESCPYIVKDSVRVEYLGDDGKFHNANFTLEQEINVVGYNLSKDVQEYTICKPIITLDETYPAPIKGQDNIRITYEPFTLRKTMSPGVYDGQYNKQREELLNSTAVKTFGHRTMDRVFIATGNRVYYSAVNNAYYFPDDNYVQTSHKANIVGIHRFDDCLLAITGDTEAESSIYVIYGSTDNEGNSYFAVRQAVGGVGALSEGSFSTLLDEPLFLGWSGVYGIVTNDVNSTKLARKRSNQIDSKLLKEKELAKAIATVWNDYYILCVNSHCYVLDGRQKIQDKGNSTTYNYEAYYWENVPATVFEAYDNELWFGTQDGWVCKFNTDIESATKYRDGGSLKDNYIEGGTSIHARWSTPLDDDGYTQYYKTLNKKGTVVSLKPGDKTSATLYYARDGKDPTLVGEIELSSGVNFSDIDLTQFTFGRETELNELYPNRKIKKYKKLQFIIENNKIDEGLGIINLVKSFVVNGFIK